MEGWIVAAAFGIGMARMTYHFIKASDELCSLRQQLRQKDALLNLLRPSNNNQSD